MQKAYNRINWENYPSDRTPINETNLNKLDVGVNELDNRVISLDSTKLDKTEASQLVKNITLDEATGIFTITYLSGATTTIDTMLEKVVVNFDYDETNQKLVFTLDDGTVKEVDLKALITEYEFEATDTVAFFVDANGKISANVKDGSIQEQHLRPNYLADIRVESAKAEASAVASDASAIASESSAVRAESWTVGGTNTRTDEDTDNAKFYYEASKQIFNDFEDVGAVVGVKGDAETDYRTGLVNITADNVGALPITGGIVNGTTDINGITTVAYSVLSGTNYLLMYDVTDIWTSDGTTTGFSKRGFSGFIYGNRDSGYLEDHTAEINIAMSYQKDLNSPSACLLKTDNVLYAPCIVCDNTDNKYYLALTITGKKRNIRLQGMFYGDYVGKVTTDTTRYTVEYNNYTNINKDIISKGAINDGNGKIISDTYMPYGGYYSGEVSINDITTVGIHRKWIDINSDDGKYLGLTQSEQVAIIVTKESGLIKQYIICFGEEGITSNRMYWRSTNSQTNLTFTYDTPLQTLCYTFTPDAGDNSNRIATTEWVNNLVQNSAITVGSYPYNGITDLLKFPIGTYRFGSNSVINQYVNTLNSAGILIVESIAPSKSPWEYAYGYRQYTFHTYQNDLYIRTVESGSSAGEISHDTGWVKITTNSQILNTATAIEASTSSENIVGVQGLKDYVGKNSYMLSPKNVTAGNYISISVENYTAYLCVVVVVPSNSERAKLEYSKNSDGKWFLRNKETNADSGSMVNTPTLHFTTEIGFTVSSDVIYAIESAF